MINFNLLSKFFSTHSPTLTKIPKLDSSMLLYLTSIWINFITIQNNLVKIPSRKGQTLFQACVKGRIQFYHSCHGQDIYPFHLKPKDPFQLGPFCHYCQVIIPQPWNSKIYNDQKPQIDEEFVIQRSDTQHIHSRLACCIMVQPWMDEMTVRQCVTQYPRASVQEQDMPAEYW